MKARKRFHVEPSYRIFAIHIAGDYFIVESTFSISLYFSMVLLTISSGRGRWRIFIPVSGLKVVPDKLFVVTDGG